jgi:hypothetical protein
MAKSLFSWRRGLGALAGVSAACLSLGAAFARPAQTTQAPGAPLDVENAEIVQLEHRWLQDDQTGNAADLNRILASDFLRPYPPGGTFIGKKAMLLYAHTRAAHAGGPQAKFDQLRVWFYGDTAIARGVLTTKDAHGQVVRKLLFTDVFVRRQGRWQAVSAQENEAPAR